MRGIRIKTMLIFFYLFYLPVQTKSKGLWLNVVLDMFSKSTQTSHGKILPNSMRAGIKTYRQADILLDRQI
jgi:hypothetical protein